MTQEDKAKRYDELLLKLQKAKVDDNVCDEMYYRVIDDIVPELSESEDERIRKSIIENLKGNMCRTDGDYDLLNKQIAWLEKQGEQKQDPCDNCKDVRLNCHNFPCIKKKAFKQGKSALEVINEEKVDNANKVEPRQDEAKIHPSDFDCGRLSICKELMNFLDTLEVKEVDLEKEAELIANGIMIDVQTNKYNTVVYNTKRNDFNHSHLMLAARKGIEVGLKAAQKGE